MVRHYFKIAWRNLLKYKTQSIISVLGLAIGFTAFAFTLSWIRFEQGFDEHIADAERIYRVFKLNNRNENGVQYDLPVPLKKYLEGFPEVEAVTAINQAKSDIRDKFGDFVIRDADIMLADTSFFKVFYPHIKININIVDDEDYLIISDKAAKSMNIDRNRFGQYNDTLGVTVNNIIEGLPSVQTNVPFDLMYIRRLYEDPDCPWCHYSNSMFVRLHDNVDVESLKSKLEYVDIEGSMQGVMSFILVPLRETHYTYPPDKAKIKYSHLQIFITVSFLVILSALFNYLMLFINNIRLRSRESKLRKVNGASNISILKLLITEIGLVLLFSLFISAILIELLYSPFSKLSEIDAPKSFFINEMIFYGFFILIFSAIILLISIYILNNKDISKSVNHNFTKVSLFLQLLVGILLCFCTSIFLYQYKTLNKSDIGFNRFNINTFQSNVHFTKDAVEKIPGVEDAIFFNGQFLPRNFTSSLQYKTAYNEEINVDLIKFHEPEVVDFFEFKIIEGRNIQYGERYTCLINETAVNQLGLDNPLGEEISIFTVVGVIRDINIDPPSLPVMPTVYALHERMDSQAKVKNPETGEYDLETALVPSSEAEGISRDFNSFAYKYKDGFKESIEKKLEQLVDYQGGRYVRFNNLEEIYADYTKSEGYLLILLSAMTSVAILIAVFGIYSMVTLACNRRRKEIAIRKVNGATVKEIFMLFFKQYLWITIAASAVAFPIGVYVMQRWLEQYTRRVSMEWWIFAAVFALVLIIVMASMIFRVVKAARENPAEVVKSE